MGKKILSLDMGVTSLGYAVLEEQDKNSYSLLDYGVVMRNNPYADNAPSQKQRREFTSSRDLIKKRKKRVQQIKNIFKEFSLNFSDKKYYDIWKLRAKDVYERRLDNDELFAIFRYLAKHRGYKSIKLSDLIKEQEIKRKNKGKLQDCESDEIYLPKSNDFIEALTYIDSLRCKYKEKSIATIIYDMQEDKKQKVFRNKNNIYNYMIRREDIEKEITLILDSQSKFGLLDSKKIEEFKNRLTDIIITQDSVKLNPENLSNCSVYKEEKVSPKFSYRFDIFNLYKVINDLKIDGKDATKGQKETILNSIFDDIKNLKNTPNLSVESVKKILGIVDPHDDIKINNFSTFRVDKKKKKEKNILIKFNFLAHLKKFDKDIMKAIFEKENSEEILDGIATAFHLNIQPQDVIEAIKEIFSKNSISFDDEKVIDFIFALHKNKVAGTSNYSFKALKELIKLMRDGYNESGAKEVVGIGKSEDYSIYPKGIKYLKPIDKKGTLQYELDEGNITNHTVKSITSWVIRVIIALHSKYGRFDIIKLESTRELSQPDKVKREIETAQKARQKEWERYIKEYQHHLDDNGIKSSERNQYIRKIKLWKQQKELGIYSNKYMGINDVLSTNTEIEHIVPQKAGGVNAEYNLALDFADENRKKSKKLPLEYLSGDKEQIFKDFVKVLKDEHKINFKKMKNLLATNLKEIYKEITDDSGFHATSYTEKLVGEILKRYYPFDEDIKQNQRVEHISGRATNYLRKILHIENKSRDTNFHHCEDAILIGIMSKAYLKQISTNFEKNYELTKQNTKDGFANIAPNIEGVEPNRLIAEFQKEYQRDIKNNPFYQNLVTKELKTPYFWVSKKPIGTKAHNKTIQSKKDKGYHIPIEDLLGNIDVKYNTDIEKFKKDFDEKIYQKLQVVKYNPKDFLAVAFLKKRDKVVQILQENQNLKSKEEQEKINKLLKETLQEDIKDPNGNTVKRVRRVGEEASIFVRGGYAATASSLVSMRCSYNGEKYLNLKRLDIRNYVKNKIAKAHEIDVFENDLIEIYVIKSKQVTFRATGVLKGFFISSKANGVKLRNPKYPLLKEKQPKINVFQGDTSIGTCCGIKKYKIDALGNILGFYYLGRILHNEKELFSKNVNYQKI